MADKKYIESVTDITPKKAAQSWNGSTLRGVSGNTSQNLANYEKGYTQSDSVTKAQQNLANVQTNKPGDFSSGFESELSDLYEQIKNRPNFSYDMDSDALYKKYADMYQRQGKQAMKDTIGQASAMTGGYGNSYAETAGYQAYQSYLDQLNDKSMDFYQMALDRYDKEGERLNDLYGLAKGRYDTDYSHYRDAVSDYYQDYANAYEAYTDERGFDYGKYSDMLNYWQQQAQAENEDWWNQTNFDEEVRQFDDNMAYQKERDAKEDSQWEQEFAYQKEQDAIANALAAKSYSSGKSSSGGSGEDAASATRADYSAIKKEMKTLFNDNGGDSAKIVSGGAVMEALANYVANGYISDAQAESIADEVVGDMEILGLSPTNMGKYGVKTRIGTGKITDEDGVHDYLKNKPYASSSYGS